jgi:hypothetical protein
MNAASDANGMGWRSWLIGLVSVAWAVTFVLGTWGWFSVAFGIGSSCTDDFSCGYDSCAPVRHQPALGGPSGGDRL